MWDEDSFNRHRYREIKHFIGSHVFNGSLYRCRGVLGVDHGRVNRQCKRRRIGNVGCNDSAKNKTFHKNLYAVIIPIPDAQTELLESCI